MTRIHYSEDEEQKLVIHWSWMHLNEYPELKWLHHIPNGGKRSAKEGADFKHMGVRSGVSDLCLPYAHGKYIGLYVEMKAFSGRLQPSQKEFLHDMAEAGHYVATCHGSETAIDVILNYLRLNHGCEMPWPNNSEFKARESALNK